MFSRSESKTQIETLTGQLETLTAEGANQQASITKLTSEKETLASEKESLTEKVTTLTTENESLKTQLAEANEKIDGHAEELSKFEKKVDSRAIEIASSAGTDPVVDDGEGHSGGDESFDKRFATAQKQGGTVFSQFMSENSKEISELLKNNK